MQQDISIRAMPGKAIVWFKPYSRSSGVIDLPDNATPQSVEGIIVDDATGYGLPVGATVMVSRTRGNGEYFTVAEKELCCVGREGLLLIQEAA